MSHLKSLRLSFRREFFVRNGIWVFIAFFVTALAILSGWNRASNETGVYPVWDDSRRLPNVTLTDQYEQHLPLASLEGKPALFDFIYTSCSGECQLLTQHMKLVADKLGPDLGTKVSLVSITTDPEHDSPHRLLDYAKAFNANLSGWYFLTGPPAQIDELMRGLGLKRSRDSNGEIDHVLGYFLVSPDGHDMVEYSQRVDPSIPARDAKEAGTPKTLIGRLTANLRLQ